MISLHRLGHQAEPFFLNPDLIVTIEATPDTVVALTTGTKIVVAEPPDVVVARIRDYRIDVLAGAIDRRHEGEPQPHTVSARRAAQGMLVALDREDAPQPPHPEGAPGHPD
jgi:flagellar protein FlbD